MQRIVNFTRTCEPNQVFRPPIGYSPQLVKVGTPKETAPDERRVALVPDSATRLAAATLEVSVESGAGSAAYITDEAYQQAGVKIVKGAAALMGEADALLSGPDAMVISQTALVIDTARAKKLPTMFTELDSVVKGGLASYGVSYSAMGRLSARYVQRILLGANPGDLPVEQVDKLDFVINLKTARALGLTIPQSLLLRADEVIQ